MNRPTYVLRGHNPKFTRDLAATYFQTVLKAFGRKLGVTFTEANIRQMQLPLAEGGMGLPNFQEEAFTAYIAAVIQFLATLKEENQTLNTTSLEAELLPLLDEWKNLLGTSLPQEYNIQSPLLLEKFLKLSSKQIQRLQDSLTKPLKLKRQTDFQEYISTQDAATRQAFHCISTGDSSWLTALPKWDCKFSNAEFRISFLSRLRIPLPELLTLPVKRCKCQAMTNRHPEIDAHGDHLMTCNHIKGKERTILHDNIVRYLSSLDRQARIPTEVEPRGKYIAASIRQQPHGPKETQLLTDLRSEDQQVTSNGKPTLSDISGTHGISVGHFANPEQETILTTEQILRRRANSKCAKYEESVNELEYNFRPLIFETLGGAREAQLEDFLQTRSTIIALRLGTDAGSLKFYFRQQLSCIIRKDVARTIIDRTERLLKRYYPMHTDQDFYDRFSNSMHIETSYTRS
jgi:hypothetical protein